MQLGQVESKSGRAWHWPVPATLIDRALWALFVLNAILMAYFIFRGYRPEFHSDSAIKNLLAQEIYETGSYFPADWNYVNGDLWIIFGQAFVLPFVPWLRNGYALHAVSGLISACLILGGVWLVMSIFVESKWLRRIALIVVAGGLSALGAENLYGQVSYGNVFFIACFTLYLSWRFLKATGSGAIKWACGLLVLLILSFWSNPQRAIAYDLVPLFAAVAARLTTRFERDELVRSSQLCMIWVASAAGGVVLHSLTLASATNITGASSALWLPFELMVRNFGMSFQGLLALLGGLPTSGQAVMSKEGLYGGIRMVAALISLVLIPSALLAAIRSTQPERRFVAAYAAAGLLLFFFLQVTTTTPDMSDPGMSARYMFPALLFALLVLVSSLGDTGHGLPFKVCAAVAVAALALSALHPANPLSRGLYGTPRDSRDDLVAYLKSQGLRYGYATYWNAGANTVISGGDVRVRQVIPQKGMLVPFRHLSSNRWYRPEAWTGPTFLMLTDAELASLDFDRIVAYAGEPSQRLRHGGFSIFVFPRNLAATLPLWANGVPADLMQMSPAHNVGSLETREGHLALVAKQGEIGFLHAGPYLSPEAGRYRLEIDVEVAAPNAGSLDVATNLGANILAAKPIAVPGRQTISLEFDVRKGITDLEVRVQTSGASEMTLRSLKLQRIVQESRRS